MGRVVYRSMPTVPVSGVILDIVRVSERKNADAGVSGLLLYGERRYLQFLEGAAADLAATMARIRADRRHRILWEAATSIGARVVAEALPMGYLSGAEVSAARGPGDRALLTDPRREEADAVVAALLDLGARKYPSAVRVPTGHL